MEKKTVILGAGLTGLSCAHFLKENYEIFEKEKQVGGLARTFNRSGFIFDCTGHWLHLSDSFFQSFVLNLIGKHLIEIKRNAEIFLYNTKIRYPFQAHTYGLPPPIISECILGFFRARENELIGKHKQAQSFLDYIYQKLGDGIAQHFMIPYNTKLWTINPSELAYSWCKRFVPIPSPEEVILGALTPEGSKNAMGYNSTFYYPRTQGISLLAETLSGVLKEPVQKNFCAQIIDWENKLIIFNNQKQIHYHSLVSTLPLTDLITALKSAPEAILDAQKKLRAISITYWDLGFTGPFNNTAAHWTYYPEPQFSFYRTGSPSAVSPSCSPKGSCSFYAEVSHTRGTSCSVRDEDILKSLISAGLIANNQIPVVINKSTIDCAYVIMDSAYEDARKTILDWLLSQNIFSTGRYGAWTYDSMEGALRNGRDTALRIREMP